MKKNTLILCSSKENIKWASKYIAKHSQENVSIISTAPEAIAYCHSKKVEFYFLADFQHFQKPIEKSMEKILIKSHYILKIIQEYAKKIDLKIGNNNLISVLNDIIIFQIYDVILIYETSKIIFGRLKPTKIIVPYVSNFLHINSANNSNALAYYLQYYFTQQKHILTYKERNRKTNKFFKFVCSLPWFIKDILVYFFYSITRNDTFKKVNTTTNKKSIVMQAGGIMTSYYYELYKKLSAIFDFHLITYKLLIPQKNELYRRQIPFTSFESFYPPNTNSKIDTIYSLLYQKINNMSDLKNELSQIGKLDQLFSSLVYMETIKLLTSRLKSTILKIKTNENILKIFKPHLILNTHDPSLFGTTFVLPAKNISIKSLLLLHGIPLQKKPYEIYSNVVQTWSRKTSLYFNGLSKKVHINKTGFTKMDEYYLKTINKKAGRKSKQIRVGFILAVYHPFNSHLQKYFYEVFKEFQQQYPQVKLHFRFHEGFIYNDLYSLADAFSIQVVDCSNQQLEEFIEDCDIHVVWDTTAILWAMMYKKPIIHTSSNWSPPILPTQEYKASWNPKSAQELVAIVRKLAEQPEIYKKYISGQKRFLEDYCGPLDGKATERLEKLIIKLAHVTNL